ACLHAARRGGARGGAAPRGMARQARGPVAARAAPALTRGRGRFLGLAQEVPARTRSRRYPDRRMERKSITTTPAAVACDVCGRTLLRGEHADPFIAGGARRMVCELCVARAANEGWIREGADN